MFCSFFFIPVIPKLLPFTFGEEPLNSGQVVTVPCAVVQGDQPLKLRWTLNGHAISPHSGISIVDLGERGAILSIGSVQAAHAGIFTCIAENLAGRHELSADLIVNGAKYDPKTLLKLHCVMPSISYLICCFSFLISHDFMYIFFKE